MDFFTIDPEVERLPPAQTRLLDLRLEPSLDGKRLRVALELTPFLQKPYLELTLTNPGGEVAATTSIIEPMAWKIEITLHIRPPALSGGTYTLAVVLSYPDLGEIDRCSLNVEIPAPTV
jgi:hypothetical protein